MDWVHATLDAGSFCPSVCGSAVAVVDAAVSLVGGDRVGAGISLGAAVVGTISDAGVAKTAASGTYKVLFKSGKTYIGKGLEKRMEKSAARLAEKHGDEVVTMTHSSAESGREALKEESRQIDAAGGPRSKNPDTKLYNEIDSSGKKMRQQDGEL